MSLLFRPLRLFSTIRSIPTLDVTCLCPPPYPPLPSAPIPPTLLQLAEQINEANTKIGFFCIKNAHLPPKLVPSVISSVNQFFFSPEKNKLSCRIDSPEYKPWGYFPPNTEQLQRGMDYKNPEKSYMSDVNEQFNLQAPYKERVGVPKRVFPNFPYDFEKFMTQYYNQMEQLSAKLLRAFALGLGAEENFFNDKFTPNASCLRTLFYPEQQGTLQEGQYRASSHTDYGALTILYSTGPGLQVQTRDGEWIDIDIKPNEFVVNIGDLMAVWSNDKWVSNLHRVAARKEIKKRISLAYFCNPDPNALIECIPGCEGEGKKHQPVRSGDFIMKKFKASVGEA